MASEEKERAFEAMFRGTHERILAYALRRTNAADAEDVVAETFAVAWRRFDAIPSDPLPWLYGVARRTLANSRRSWRRRIRLGSRLAASLRPAAWVDRDPAEQLGEADVMRGALRALKERDREALMLVAWEGLANQQAAAVMGVSPDAFAVRLHRARRRLQAEIDRRAGPQPVHKFPPGER